jgi:hypothetical protein
MDLADHVSLGLSLRDGKLAKDTRCSLVGRGVLLGVTEGGNCLSWAAIAEVVKVRQSEGRRLHSKCLGQMVYVHVPVSGVARLGRLELARGCGSRLTEVWLVFDSTVHVVGDID